MENADETSATPVTPAATPVASGQEVCNTAKLVPVKYCVDSGYWVQAEKPTLTMRPSTTIQTEAFISA